MHRILAWPSLLLGFGAWINQHPLRTKEGGTPPMSNLMFVLYLNPSLPSDAEFTQFGIFCPRRRLSSSHLEERPCDSR
jgi:hypothetical protein